MQCIVYAEDSYRIPSLENEPESESFHTDKGVLWEDEGLDSKDWPPDFSIGTSDING